MHLQAVNVLKPTPEGGGCVPFVMARLLPNADSTACGIGRTGNPKTAILGGSRRPNGIGRGRTNFPSRGKKLDILRKAAKGIGPTLKRRAGWSWSFNTRR